MSTIFSLILVATTFLASNNVNAAVPVFPKFLAEGIKAFEPPAGVPFSYCPNGVWQPGYVVVSAEAWWRRELVPQTGPSAGTINGFDFGHLHNEVCVPHNLLPSTNTITAGTLLHQNNGNISYVVLEDRWTNQWLQQASFIKPRSAANVAAAKGIIVDSTIEPNDPTKWTVRFNDTLTVNPSTLTYSGLQRIRTLMIDHDPETFTNGQSREQKAHFSWNFLVDDSNNKPAYTAKPLDPSINSICSIGWGSKVNYSLVELYVPPKYPVGGLWRFILHVNAATPDSLPINRTLITWNPNFHKDLPGTVFQNTSGGYWNQIKMDVHSVLGASTNGWNKLVIQGKAIADDGATNTGSLAYNMQISNGADCTKGDVQTHPFGDGYMTVQTTYSSKTKSLSYPAPTRSDNNTYYNYLTPKNSTSTGATYQRILETSYSLSFLNATKGVASASVWMYVNANDGAVGRPVYLFDANVLNKTTNQPCVNPDTCNPVGSGVLGGSATWVELKFTNITFLNAANTSKKLKFWTALPVADTSLASVQIHAANNYGCPPLLITPAC